LWDSAVAALGQIVQAPPGAELWYDDRHVAALRQDQKDEAEIAGKMAQAIRTLLDAGFDPDASIEAVRGFDMSLLVGQHSGLYSVQLQEPGSEESPNGQGEIDTLETV
jgi:hypothetical protein